MKSHRMVVGFFTVMILAIVTAFLSMPGASAGDSDKDRDRGRDGRGRGHDDDEGRTESELSDSRIQRGFEISPVRLDVKGRNKSLIGLGSYIVNAQGACNDCHTCPSYEPGRNPFQSPDGRINSAHYLAGGVPFGPFTSANITPDAKGLPAGLTFEEFLSALRTGRDPHPPHDILQVMPWPVFGRMTTHDLRAVYEFLSAIPHAEPGVCKGPGE